MDNKLLELAQIIFPDVTDEDTVESLEALFPERGLKEGAKVTRIAPSPTGSMHIGNLYGALADERIAHKNGGVFYLRIEDTDDKRYVEGAEEDLINVYKYFGVNFDEGADLCGEYGPYYQRQRAEILEVGLKALAGEDIDL